jgi:site-specific DNA-methyltransferase (adenine-specific)
VSLEPYYSDSMVSLYLGKMEEVLPVLALDFDAAICDPPYGETSLAWDQWPDDWPGFVAERTTSMWCFGSMRMFTDRWLEFEGWSLAQDIVWEKQAGSGFAADRFKRVHEHVLHFYRGAWSSVHHDAVREAYHGVNKGTLKGRAAIEHTGDIGCHEWTDDGTRMVRSVLRVQNMHQRGGIHPTQKPLGILSPLIEYSVPLGGLVLDPFAGSASTLLTARSLGRGAVGIEKYEPYCEKAAKRLAEPDLFGGAA